MKKFIIFLLIPCLSACGAAKTTPSKSTSKILIPANCLTSAVITAVQAEIPGSEFIDTKWEPAPNTELFDVLSNGGLACSYGLASAGIGVTVRWVLDKENNYEKWVNNWMKAGYQKVNLRLYGIDSGYFISKPQSDTQEFSIWNLNFKQGGVWVSIYRSSGTDLTSGANIIKAVLKV